MTDEEEARVREIIRREVLEEFHIDIKRIDQLKDERRRRD